MSLELFNGLHVALCMSCIALGFVLFRFIHPPTTETSNGGRFQAEHIVLLLALVFGAALRFYGLRFGFPEYYHPDEQQKASFLNSMIRRQSIDQNFGLQPPFLLYLSWAFRNVIRWFDMSPGKTMLLNLLAGRTINAICGVLSIYIVYLIGRLAYSARIGAWAALFVAVSPLHITNSRYMKEDVLFLTFVLLCVMAVLRFLRSRNYNWYYLAGLMAGFAFGSKYTGIVCIVILVGTPWLNTGKFSFRPDISTLKRLPIAAFCMVIAFFLVNPWALVEPEDVIGGFRAESKHALGGHLGLSIDAWTHYWMYHFSRSIIPGFGIILTIAALIALGVFLRRWNSIGLFFIGLVLLFYLPAEYAHSKPPPQPDRYVLPTIPFLAIAAAYFLEGLAARLSKDRPKELALLFVSVAAIFPAIYSMQLASEIRFDTRKQMTQWIVENIPPGQKIMTVGGTCYLAPVPLKYPSAVLRKVIGREKAHIVQRLRDSGYDYLLTTNPTPERFAVNSKSKEASRKAFQEIEDNFLVKKEIRSHYGGYGFHNPVLTLYSLHEAPPAKEPDKQ